MKRYAGIGLFALGLVAAGALALPAIRAAGSPGCEPKSWMDWHLAMRQECLAPRYVCEHMTSAEMLRDPEIATAYHEALAAGEHGEVHRLSRMVERMRARYGCEPEAGAAPGRGAAASPSGRLPPGHPPVGGSCPFAGPDADRGAHSAGPLPFAFESAPTVTL